MNLNVACKEFKRRLAENDGKQIDNSRLPAGSPMYYYCEGCGILVETKPENWWRTPPPKHCVPCKVLLEQGVLDRLIKEAKEGIKQEVR